MSERDVAAREWQNEVDVEAARLIRSGWSPYEADRQAVMIVNSRRSIAARKKELAP